MVTHLPADIELAFGFRKLSDLLGRENAAFVFLRLWLDLAFQTRIHGKAGVYGKVHQQHFEDSTRAIRNVIDSLFKSGLIAETKSGDWFCPIFFEYNAHLDRSYIPPTAKWMEHWARLEENLATDSRKLMKRVPSAFWYLPDGSVISESCMNRALVLIHTLDFILHKKARKANELDIGTIQGACSIVTAHSEAKISVLLRRFMSVSRPRLNPLFPPTTEEALQKFDDLLVLASPDEGFEAWIKRVNTSHEEKEIQPESIGREIVERITGI